MPEGRACDEVVVRFVGLTRRAEVGCVVPLVFGATRSRDDSVERWVTSTVLRAVAPVTSRLVVRRLTSGIVRRGVVALVLEPVVAAALGARRLVPELELVATRLTPELGAVAKRLVRLAALDGAVRGVNLSRASGNT